VSVWSGANVSWGEFGFRPILAASWTLTIHVPEGDVTSGCVVTVNPSGVVRFMEPMLPWLAGSLVIWTVNWVVWFTSTVVGVNVTLKMWFPGGAACVVRTLDIVDSVISAIMNRVTVLFSFFILFALLIIRVV
jgi:hypothetical protein